MVRLIISCFLLALYAMHSCAERYDYDIYFRLAIHYEQCMVWMHNAEFKFYEFHVFPPWQGRETSIKPTCKSEEGECVRSQSQR
eukprot:3213927-Rhodomonas_salina.2